MCVCVWGGGGGEGGGTLSKVRTQPHQDSAISRTNIHSVTPVPYLMNHLETLSEPVSFA